MKSLQYRDDIRLVRILTSNNRHCLLLTVGEDHYVAVKSGFGSGYGGEGARTFSYVLHLLDAHGIEIREYEVRQNVLDRLDKCALKPTDIENLTTASERRNGNWRDYTWDIHDNMSENGTTWKPFRSIIPFSNVDPRIFDLAVSFWTGPDERLLTGYRRLEDLVRKRTGSDEYGQKLFSVAFNPKSGKLFWEDVSDTETIGRMSLFTGAFMAFRNPRAHVEQNERSNDQLSEFLLLNLLYSLERQAIERNPQEKPKTTTQDTTKDTISNKET
jgi:hypothetical protein